MPPAGPAWKPSRATPRSMMDIQLSPIELRSHAIDQQLFGWEVWEHFSDLAYLRFVGKSASNLDVLNIKWRIEESCHLVRCKGILVDLREVELLTAGLDVSLLRKRTLGKVIRVAIADDVNRSLLQNAEEREISEKFDHLASDFFSAAEFAQSKRLGSAGQIAQRLNSKQPISLDISPLRVRCYRWSSTVTGRVSGAISISGHYARGSDGKLDGMWISWQVDHLCEFLNPHSLLVDLSELDYEWGDDLFLQPTEPLDGQLRVVISPARYAAFRGVLGDRDLRTDRALALTELCD
jgi:hypothetical protein